MSRNLYHDHLDVCQECREGVMLTSCRVGPRLLHLQVTGNAPGPSPTQAPFTSPTDDLLEAIGSMMASMRASTDRRR